MLALSFAFFKPVNQAVKFVSWRIEKMQRGGGIELYAVRALDDEKSDQWLRRLTLLLLYVG